MTTIDYVIATWFGRRHWTAPDYRTNPLAYLEQHLEFLGRLDTSLIRRVVVVTPSDGPRVSEWNDRARDLRVSTHELMFMSRPNLGKSYGSWVWYHQMQTDPPDYYILMEDDYVPRPQRFDERLLELLEEEKAGYVCGWADHVYRSFVPARYRGWVAKMSCGLISRDTLDQVSYEALADWDQWVFSHEILSKGGKIVDVRKRYSINCRTEGHKIVWPHGDRKPLMFAALL